MSKQILVISPSWIGDCVMTQPMLRRLHELSDCEIDVFAPQFSQAVFRRMPEIRNILDNPFAHGALQLKQRYQIGKDLGKRGYHQVIVLPNSLKSGLIAWATGIKIRTGYVGESRYFLLNDIRRLDKQKLPLMVDRYTALAHPSQDAFTGNSSQPKLMVDTNNQQHILNKLGLNTDKPILAFCPGAEYGPAKRWSPNYFAQTAQHFLQKGWQVWLFGSQKDATIAEEIQHYSGSQCVNLCGKTALNESIDLLALATFVVCNDSGLMHLSAALDRHLVALYGSTSAEHTPPLSPKAHILSLNLDCAPCFERQCPKGHTNCLQQLLPEKVITLIETQLKHIQAA